ncbi:MAG: helix-turn-helix transcriptional regulator [Brevinematales bacterium]|nr:helix-turn-helix transcriptional regulator [Brevinematales bacterium]
MKHFLLVYYALAVFSGVVGMALVVLMVCQRLGKLALVYGVFVGAFLLLLVNILFQYYSYVILGTGETPEKLWGLTLLIFLSKNLFLFGFGLIMGFLFWGKWWGRVIGGVEFVFSGVGILMAVGMAVLGFSPEKLRLLLFLDQWVWGSLMVVFLAVTLALLWFQRVWGVSFLLSRVVRVLLWLTLGFLPLFVVDNLWEIFQIRWGILPRCFNFSPLYYMVWNFLTFVYMIRFLAEKKLWLSELVQSCPSSVGGVVFSRREREIISLLIQGHDNATVAAKLFITEHTVRNYISKLYEKTGTTNRVQLVQRLLRMINEEKENPSLSK